MPNTFNPWEEIIKPTGRAWGKAGEAWLKPLEMLIAAAKANQPEQPFDFASASQTMMPQQQLQSRPMGNLYPELLADPRVARAMLAQPSQSAASYTPGRSVMEGSAPTGTGANPLASEPWPQINPLTMEPQPERTEQKDFEIADLLKFVGSPQEAEAPEKKGGMSTAAKMALGLGGLGLILALRNQYQKDKGTLGRNTSNMLGMVGRGLGGYAMYHQGEEQQKLKRDTLDTQIMLEQARQQQRGEIASANIAAANARAQATIDSAMQRIIIREQGADRRVGASIKSRETIAAQTRARLGQVMDKMLERDRHDNEEMDLIYRYHKGEFTSDADLPQPALERGLTIPILEMKYKELVADRLGQIVTGANATWAIRMANQENNPEVISLLGELGLGEEPSEANADED